MYCHCQYTHFSSVSSSCKKCVSACGVSVCVVRRLCLQSATWLTDVSISSGMCEMCLQGKGGLHILPGTTLEGKGYQSLAVTLLRCDSITMQQYIQTTLLIPLGAICSEKLILHIAQKHTHKEINTTKKKARELNVE